MEATVESLKSEKTQREDELPPIVTGIDIEIHDWLDGEERWQEGFTFPHVFGHT